MGAPVDAVMTFCHAASMGDVIEAEELLERHPELIDSPAVVAMLGDDEQLTALLAADPEAASGELRPGVTPLYLACLSQYGGHDDDWRERLTACVRLLIDHGAPLDSGPVDGHLPGGRSSPLAAAVSALGHEPLCDQLLRAGAPADDVAALVLAVALQRWDCVDVLTAHGADWNRTTADGAEAPLHRLLDDGALTEETLQRLLLAGADPGLTVGPLGETALHVAVRRRRVELSSCLVTGGAALEATTSGGMTPWRHALRRHFTEVAETLDRLGADTTLSPADELAVALWEDDLDRAWELLLADRALGTAGPPEERRLLPDLAAMNRTRAVAALLDAGWELDARGLDGGTALHSACWFAAEETAALLLQRGAPLQLRGDDHDCTPLGWLAHGSRFCGGAEARGEAYVRLAALLLEHGAPLPGPDDDHDQQQFAEAADPVQTVLSEHGWTTPVED